MGPRLERNEGTIEQVIAQVMICVNGVVSLTGLTSQGGARTVVVDGLRSTVVFVS